MGYLPLILAAAAVTYLTRIAGFTLQGRTLPPTVDRALAYVPVAVFTALIVPGISDVGGSEQVSRLVGALIAGGAVALTGRLWITLVAGMAGYWAVGLVV